MIDLTEDYVARFGGVARLFGAAALEKMRASHVCVVGIGGVGSWVVEALARSGVGALTLVDGDDVCLTNVNRQLPALTGTIGRPKVAVMTERAALISSSCRVEARAEFYTKLNSASLLDGGFDLLVDCMDRMSIKAHIIHECRRRKLRVLTCGAAGGRRDPTAVESRDLGYTGNDELLREVRRKLRRDYGWPEGMPGIAKPMGVPCVFSREKPVFPRVDGTCGSEREPGESLRIDCATGFGAATFVTGVFGFIAAAEVVRLLSAADISEQPLTGGDGRMQITNDE